MHDLRLPEILYNFQAYLSIPILATYLCNTVVKVNVAPDVN